MPPNRPFHQQWNPTGPGQQPKPRDIRRMAAVLKNLSRRTSDDSTNVEWVIEDKVLEVQLENRKQRNGVQKQQQESNMESSVTNDQKQNCRRKNKGRKNNRERDVTRVKTSDDKKTFEANCTLGNSGHNEAVLVIDNIQIPQTESSSDEEQVCDNFDDGFLFKKHQKKAAKFSSMEDIFVPDYRKMSRAIFELILQMMLILGVLMLLLLLTVLKTTSKCKVIGFIISTVLLFYYYFIWL